MQKRASPKADPFQLNLTSLEHKHQSQIHQRLTAKRRCAWVVCQLAEGCGVAEVHCSGWSSKVIGLVRAGCSVETTSFIDELGPKNASHVI